LRKFVESDADFAEWVTAQNVTGNAGMVVEDLRTWFTYELALYKLDHALDERGELDAEKLEEAAKEFEKAAEILEKAEGVGITTSPPAVGLLGPVSSPQKAGRSFSRRAEGFRELWREAEEHLELTADYLATAAGTLGECLVYLAASGDKERAEELLKKWRWLLDYVPEVSVNTRLMLRLFGVGDGARLKEVVDVFEQELSPEFLPALWLLAGRLQRDKVPDECNRLSNAQLSKAEVCDIIVAAAAGNRAAAEMLRSVLEKVVPEAHQLIEKADGRTLVEVLAPEFSWARLAFMLLAAVEGRTKAVRLHGLLGSAEFRRPLARRLFRAVYENCGDLNSEGCRMALLKLYYYHI
jgi:tetratricopeptide (TPR) repeat protein